MDNTCSIPACSKPTKARGWCSAHWYHWRYNGDPNYSSFTVKGEPLKWLEEAIKLETDKCITWPFYRNPAGYGQVRVSGTNWLTHRFALVRRVGTGAPGELALHKPLLCHNRACLNYRHLYWGSQTENMRDAIVDGTVRRGDDSPVAKLSADDVRAILVDSRLHREIAEQYGVGRQTVDHIKSRKGWKHISVQEAA